MQKVLSTGLIVFFIVTTLTPLQSYGSESNACQCAHQACRCKHVAGKCQCELKKMVQKKTSHTHCSLKKKQNENLTGWKPVGCGSDTERAILIHQSKDFFIVTFQFFSFMEERSFFLTKNSALNLPIFELRLIKPPRFSS